MQINADLTKDLLKELAIYQDMMLLNKTKQDFI